MTPNFTQRLSALAGTCMFLCACPATKPAGVVASDPTQPRPPPVETLVLEGATKGGPIAVSPSGATLAVANKTTGDVTLFALPDMTERARVSVGDEPASVCWHPNDATLFVVNRASATVQKITGANGTTPTASAGLDVGSEPSNCAASPTGDKLFVSNWVDGTLSVVRTEAMTIARTVQLGGAPYAVCVSNDGDKEDADETIYVTDFYSRPIDGATEASDVGRQGRVFAVPVSTYIPSAITLEPFADAAIDATPGTGAYPNQLYACAINAGRLYITSVGASPEPFERTTDFRQNIQGLVHVVDLSSGRVDLDRTINVNTLVDAQTAPKRFVSVPTDIAFAKNSDIGYVASILSNSLFRVDWTNGAPTGGAPTTNFLESGSSPTGVAIRDTTAYVYNEVGRSVSVIDLARQSTLQKDVASAPQPSNAGDRRALTGQKFFNTGLARWSANGWVGCVGCHPFGTTDNVTWVFPAGPRQTVDLSGTFDKSGATQRILNWTAIFDEVHDFELNTRGVANGTGAIVSSAELSPDGKPNGTARIDFVGPGGVGNPENGFNIGSAKAVAAGGATPDDWDEIEDYIRTIRSPRAARTTDASVTNGRAIFEQANCHHCHGGVLWTLSERYYEPLLGQDARGLSLASQGIATLGSVRVDQVSGADTSALTVLANDANGPPARHTCVVRKVGTFGATGPADRGAGEIRQNGNAAQGVDGFNVPSLLGANMGAPYLHNGAAESLDELLDPRGAFVDHLRSGNLVFSPSPSELADLVAFLRTIDDDTPVIDVPLDYRFCPNGLQ